METSITQSTVTVDQRRERKGDNKEEEKGCVMYDEVKPNCAETAISLKSSHIHYCETHFSFVIINFMIM